MKPLLNEGNTPLLVQVYLATSSSLSYTHPLGNLLSFIRTVPYIVLVGVMAGKTTNKLSISSDVKPVSFKDFIELQLKNGCTLILKLVQLDKSRDIKDEHDSKV